MLRVVDDKGCVVLGINRAVLVRMLAGQRFCVPAGHGAPHICLFYEDTDDALLARSREMHPDGLMPGASVEDHRVPADAKEPG